jgi:hypothetical protein
MRYFILIIIFHVLINSHLIHAQEIKQMDDSVKDKRQAAYDKLKLLIPEFKLMQQIDPKTESFKGINAIDNKKGDEILSLLLYFPEIEFLNMHNSYITNKSVISNFKNIKHLDLSKTNTTDGDMIFIKDLIHIEELYLHDNEITDEGIKYIQSLVKIKDLGLGNTKMSDEGIKYLSKLSNIEDLQIMHTHVGDKGVLYLSGMNKLRILYLNSTDVTVDGLLKIKGLDMLALIELADTQFAKESEEQKNTDIERLKKVFPKLIGVYVTDYSKRVPRLGPSYNKK